MSMLFKKEIRSLFSPTSMLHAHLLGLGWHLPNAGVLMSIVHLSATL